MPIHAVCGVDGFFSARYFMIARTRVINAAMSIGLVTSARMPWQYPHFTRRDRNPVSFSAQIRFVYLGLLALGMWGPFHFIHYLQLIGSMALVLNGYCPLARTLVLMPWNRRAPFTLSLARIAYLTPPVRGSILQVLPAGHPRYV